MVGFETLVKLVITVLPPGKVVVVAFSAAMEPVPPGGFPGHTSRVVESARPRAAWPITMAITRLIVRYLMFLGAPQN